MESSADLDRDEEELENEAHIADHMFHNNHQLAAAQGFVPSHMNVEEMGLDDMDGEPNTIYHNDVVESNPDVVNEDDSLLFEFAGRNPPNAGPNHMHHHNIRQTSG